MKKKNKKNKRIETKIKGLGTFRVFKSNNEESNVVCYATLNIGDKVYINGIKIVVYEDDNGKNKKFLSLPTYKNKDGEYKPYVLFDKDTRKLVEKSLIDACKGSDKDDSDVDDDELPFV